MEEIFLSSPSLWFCWITLCTLVTFQHPYNGVWKSVCEYLLLLCLRVCVLQRVSVCVTLPQGPERRPTSCCHHSDDFICAAMCSTVYFASQNSHSRLAHPCRQRHKQKRPRGWYWWDIECNQSLAPLNRVTMTGHELEQRDGTVNQADRKQTL